MDERKSIERLEAGLNVKFGSGIECMRDVVSHYDDFRSALIEIKASNETSKSDESYWQHQIDVLTRMKQQAETFLLAFDKPQAG